MANQNEHKLLYETNKFAIGHIYENAYLIEKSSNKIVFLHSFYGDPNCALISEDNTWGIIGGSSLLLFTIKETIEMQNLKLEWISGLRQIENFKVEILIDPFSENSAMWELDILTGEKRKVKDFFKYRDLPYTEKIEW